MAYEVLMPQLGLTMELGVVSQWMKQEGDPVSVGDVLLEIETDKLTSEVVSEHEGTLLKIVAKEGEDIPVKGLLAWIGQPGEALAAAAPAAPATSTEPAGAPAAPAEEEEPAAAYEVLMPQLGLTMELGVVSQWMKQEGDPVSVGDVLLEIETDKLTSEVVSEYEGTLLKIVAQEGEEVPVKGLLCLIGQPGGAPFAAEGGRIKISPLAKKTAAELDVDYSGLTGSGSSGRIVQKDILDAAESQKAALAQAPVVAAEPAPKAAPNTGLSLMEGDTVAKLSGMRKVVAERMLQSHTEIPPVTQTTKVDVTELMELRRRLLAEAGKKFSVNDLILRAVATTLAAHPEILVSYDGNQIIQRAHVNLGMAVALDAGLIVPVIRDADQLGLEALSAAAKDLAARAKENKLTPDEYKDSTFSVTNLGMFGIESFTPIINQPDAAILGVCAIQDELVMDDEGTITKRQVLRLCLTYDHRLLDGAVAAKFIMELRDLLQTPVRILL